MTETAATIRNYILDCLQGDVEIGESDDLALLETGLVDSFSFMELLGAVEKNFSVRIDFGGHDPQELTSLVGLTRIVCESMGVEVADLAAAGQLSNLAAIGPDHESWKELAGLFEEMHREFDSKGLLLPIVPDGGNLWLSGLEKASSNSTPVIGAIREGQLVGFVSSILKMLPPYLGGRVVGEIVFLYVKPDHRRFDLGTQLANAAIDEMRKRGASSIELKVLADNAGGRQFWESIGFAMELHQLRLQGE